ncbi:SDR family NAD(P)-dependent oxidoreductase [Georgenia faecalis]|uniref:SDR family NAD(P)-dependent oxidoreductase n=1 Tax=Georgenia faecalis TaxID=2483799 RepID=A0ABV9D743_9MICO|nr:SDR family NAD(P)-dependent oxidoreductase [Georgenia faecalis]
MARRGTALVTGATSGIGLEIAWALAAGHHHLVLVARDADRLEALAAQLRAAAAIEVEVLPADLADRRALDRVAERLRSTERPVDLLVNNAGFALRQRFVGGDIGREEGALDVMVRAVMVLSHAATGAMVARGRGAVLNVSSVAALTTMGTYAAHKAWVRTFTESLAAELAGTGVTATVLCPGLVHTEFHSRAQMRTDAWPELAWIDAARVAEAALAGVRRGAVVVTPSLRYRAVSAFLRLAPRAVVRSAAGPRRRGPSLATGTPAAPDAGADSLPA